MSVEVEPTRIEILPVYEPSGRIAWQHFGPLAGMGLVLSALMAGVLYRLDPYVQVITPIVLSIPVLVCLAMAIHVGLCRSYVYSVVLGVTMVTLYYVGYWGLSYHSFVSVMGPAGQSELRAWVGVDGFVGYLLARSIPPGGGHGGRVLGVVIRGIEYGVPLSVAVYLARRLAGRVFYEDYGKWGSITSFGFEPELLPKVIDVSQRQAWEELGRIDKQSSQVDQVRRGRILFRVEYLRGTRDQPMYVTVEGARLARVRWLLYVLPWLGRMRRRWIDRVIVPAASAHELARHVGGVDVEPLADAPSRSADGNVIGYWSESTTTRATSGGTLGAFVQEQGWTGVTMVGKGQDFRDAANEASARAMRGGVESSLCYPAGDANRVCALKRFALLENVLVRAFFLLSMGSCFLPLISRSLAAQGRDGWAMLLILVSMGMLVLSLSCLAVLMFFYRPIQMWRLAHHFAKRGDALFTSRTQLKCELLRVEDPKTFHITKSTPEDVGIAAFDHGNHRLLLEGVSHRYVIRGQDVCYLRPLQGTSSIGAEIGCRVMDVEFALVVYRFSMINVVLYAFTTFPLLGFMMKGFTVAPSRRFTMKLTELFEQGK